MNNQTEIFNDLLKIINHDDYDEEIMRRILIFCSYHKLLNKSLYYELPEERLRDLADSVFENIGEKAESL